VWLKVHRHFTGGFVIMPAVAVVESDKLQLCRGLALNVGPKRFYEPILAQVPHEPGQQKAGDI
jgi:hypothetical protein